MPLVDIEQIEKEAKSKKEAVQEIISKEVDGKTYFSGKILKDKWFSDYGECVKENELEAKRKLLADLGLNEHGQTPEQEELSEKRHELFKKKDELLKKIAEIDVEIGALASGTSKQVKEVKETKKKK